MRIIIKNHGSVHDDQFDLLGTISSHMFLVVYPLPRVAKNLSFHVVTDQTYEFDRYLIFSLKLINDWLWQPMFPYKNLPFIISLKKSERRIRIYQRTRRHWLLSQTPKKWSLGAPELCLFAVICLLWVGKKWESHVDIESGKRGQGWYYAE